MTITYKHFIFICIFLSETWETKHRKNSFLMSDRKWSYSRWHTLIYIITDVGSFEELQQGSQSLLSYQESMRDPPDSPARIQQEIDNLRLELEGERELQQQHISLLVQQNLTLAECTREQLDLWVGLIQTDSMTFAVDSSFHTFQLCGSAESCKSSDSEHSFLYFFNLQLCLLFGACSLSCVLPWFIWFCSWVR